MAFRHAGSNTDRNHSKKANETECQIQEINQKHLRAITQKDIKLGSKSHQQVGRNSTIKRYLEGKA